jgi:hypothetical protein
MGGAISLAVVAKRAGAGGVTPTVFTTPAAWNQVVDREFTFSQHSTALVLTDLDATIDALIAIPL